MRPRIYHTKSGASSACEAEGVQRPMQGAPAGELPEVGVGYAYLGPEGAQVALLACKDKRTGCLAATQVPSKGVDPYALSFIVGWPRSLAWKRFIMQSDNERALF